MKKNLVDLVLRVIITLIIILNIFLFYNLIVNYHQYGVGLRYISFFYIVSISFITLLFDYRLVLKKDKFVLYVISCYLSLIALQFMSVRFGYENTLYFYAKVFLSFYVSLVSFSAFVLSNAKLIKYKYLYFVLPFLIAFSFTFIMNPSEYSYNLTVILVSLIHIASFLGMVELIQKTLYAFNSKYRILHYISAFFIFIFSTIVLMVNSDFLIIISATLLFISHGFYSHISSRV